jgi:hypothetical protein
MSEMHKVRQIICKIALYTPWNALNEQELKTTWLEYTRKFAIQSLVTAATGVENKKHKHSLMMTT